MHRRTGRAESGRSGRYDDRQLKEVSQRSLIETPLHKEKAEELKTQSFKE